MIARAGRTLTSVCWMLVLGASLASGQNQTTGRMAGTVTDERSALVVGAQITISNTTTAAERSVTTDSHGNYAVALLPPGIYSVKVTANGFNSALFDSVLAVITETTTVNAQLKAAGVIVDPVMVRVTPLLQNDGPQLGRVVDSRAVSELPLATRNFTQLLALSPGTSVSLPDNTALGRNSQNISVNGARVTQNDFEINGIDANNLGTNAAS